MVSHDLEVAQYVDRLAVLDGGRVIEFAKPETLIKLFFPSNGQTILMHFNSITDRLIKQLKSIDTIQYILKVGRNSLKIFAHGIPGELNKLLDLIYENNIHFQSFSIDQASFLDYFRIRIHETRLENSITWL